MIVLGWAQPRSAVLYKETERSANNETDRQSERRSMYKQQTHQEL